MLRGKFCKRKIIILKFKHLISVKANSNFKKFGFKKKVLYTGIGLLARRSQNITV